MSLTSPYVGNVKLGRQGGRAYVGNDTALMASTHCTSGACRLSYFAQRGEKAPSRAPRSSRARSRDLASEAFPRPQRTWRSDTWGKALAPDVCNTGTAPGTVGLTGCGLVIPRVAIGRELCRRGTGTAAGAAGFDASDGLSEPARPYLPCAQDLPPPEPAQMPTA